MQSVKRPLSPHLALQTADASAVIHHPSRHRSRAVRWRAHISLLADGLAGGPEVYAQAHGLLTSVLATSCSSPSAGRCTTTSATGFGTFSGTSERTSL